ncbi:MAG: ribosome silencing factor [Acidobacteria bacterium]|nr:ribosome silencing factor [Acidobacteriota bacterium]
MKNLEGDLKTAWKALEDKKGEEIVVLDISAISSFTDYFVIATGRSTRQTQALADSVIESLRTEGRKAGHVEGYQRGEWILLDYINFVVHIFVPEQRRFYALEKLWADARRVRTSQ